MVAPIDARASFAAGDETIALVMNFRTIALAEDEKPAIIASFGSGKPTLSGMATLIWAFAQPAHPELTLDDAMALIMRHGKEAGEALAKVFRSASAQPIGGAPASGTDNPPRKPRRSKLSKS